MVDKFGLETYTVAQAMIGNADKVAYYTKAVTGTNAATEQAAINSDTMEAKQAQLANKINSIGIALVDKLNPAFKEVISLTDKAVSLLLPLLSKISNYFIDLYRSSALVRTIVAQTALAFKVAFYTVSLGFNIIIDIVKSAGRAIKGLSILVEGIFSFSPTKVADGWRLLMNNFIKTARETWKDLKDAGNKAGNAYADGVNNGTKKIKPVSVKKKNEIDEVVVIGHRRAKKTDPAYKTPEELKAEEEARKKAEEARRKVELEARRVTQKALDAVDAEYTAKQNKLSKKYTESATMTQQEYQDEMERIELDGLEKKLTVAGIEPKKREEIAQKIMSAKTKLVDKLKDLMKIDAVNQEDTLQSELDTSKKKYDDALALLDYALKQRLLKQKDYEKAKAKITSDYDKEGTKAREKDADKKEDLAEKGYSEITKALRISRIKQNLTDNQYDKISKNARTKWLKDQLKNENLSAEKRAQLQQEVDDSELSQQEESLKQKQDLQSQYDQILQDSIVSMGTLIGEQIGNLLKNGTVDFHEFLRGILVLLIDAVEKSILASRAALLAQNLLKEGWTGLASFTLQTALITAAFEIGKAAAQNFYDGGFTPDGSWDQAQGIVHSNEFVANRYATRNPNLLPVLNLMDAAQRSGSVSNLTADDITSVLPASSNQVKATTVIANNTNNNNLIIEKLGVTLADLKKSMEKINKIFSEPIIAEAYATGKHGIIEATDLANRMKNNVTRQ